MKKILILAFAMLICYQQTSSQNIGINETTPTGKLHIKANSTTALPQLRLTEEDDDFARIKMESLASPGAFWDIAGKANAVTSNSFLNFYFANGATSGDRLTITGQGNVGIGNTNPLSLLDLKSIGDGNELLRLSTDRGWLFKQSSAGPTTRLSFQSLYNDKVFEIISPNSLNRAAMFHVNDVGSNTYLAPDNGKVGIGNTNPQAKLDVSGKIKIGNDADGAAAGSVRWNTVTQDFEGFNGLKWISLTHGRESTSWPTHSPTGTASLLNFQEADVLAGESLDMNSDYTIIGIPAFKSVAIFSYSNNTWSLMQTITPSDPSNAIGFGKAVSVSGNWIIVGAPEGVVSGVAKGKAYVFKNTAGIWSQTQIITDGAGVVDDAFGASVSMYADDMVIGAPRVNTSVVDAGKIFFYNRNVNTWDFGSSYTDPAPEAYDELGYRVSIAENYTAVSAPNWFFNRFGMVHLFKRFLSTHIWNHDVVLNPNYYKFGLILDLTAQTLVVRDEEKNYYYKLNAGSWGSGAINYDATAAASGSNNYIIGSDNFVDSPGPIVTNGYFYIRRSTAPLDVLKIQYSHDVNVAIGSNCGINESDWIAVLGTGKVFFAKISIN